MAVFLFILINTDLSEAKKERIEKGHINGRGDGRGWYGGSRDLSNLELLIYLTIGITLLSCICCCVNGCCNDKSDSCQNSNEKRCFCKLINGRNIATEKYHNHKHQPNQTSEKSKQQNLSPKAQKRVSRKASNELLENTEELPRNSQGDLKGLPLAPNKSPDIKIETSEKAKQQDSRNLSPKTPMRLPRKASNDLPKSSHQNTEGPPINSQADLKELPKSFLGNPEEPPINSQADLKELPLAPNKSPQTEGSEQSKQQELSPKAPKRLLRKASNELPKVP